MDNVPSCWSPIAPRDGDLLGLYEVVALTERDSGYSGALPEAITIYRTRCGCL